MGRKTVRPKAVLLLIGACFDKLLATGNSQDINSRSGSSYLDVAPCLAERQVGAAAVVTSMAESN